MHVTVEGEDGTQDDDDVIDEENAVEKGLVEGVEGNQENAHGEGDGVERGAKATGPGVDGLAAGQNEKVKDREGADEGGAYAPD